jgi:uncharacterized protein YndB with AHSA1/START domain
MSAIEVRVQRTFDAPRDAVFDAWTSPEVMRRWWAAEHDWSTPSAEVDLRPGGRIRVSMAEPGGEPMHTFSGEYLEVSPPERLVFTCKWEAPDSDGTVSTVSVEFREDGDRTTVVLTHSGLASDDSRESVEDGWIKCFDNLETRMLSTSERKSR